MIQLAISSCSMPQMELEPLLQLARECGYSHFELFSDWAVSRVSPRDDDAAQLRALGRSHGVAFCALHLPKVRLETLNDDINNARAAARLAREVGAPIVLYKAADLNSYRASAPLLLPEFERLGLTPVVTNHCGTAFETPAQLLEILDAVGDGRLQTLLEVGHFHSVGIGWRDALEALGASVAHVHIKDQIGAQSVPFGEGEIDLRGLFDALAARDYNGSVVIEMEVADAQNTPRYLKAAREYLAMEVAR